MQNPHLSKTALDRRQLQTLVENRTAFTLAHAELNVFETHQKAALVELRFTDPVLASMIRGKKVMHLGQRQAFDFFPGESVVLPSDELMKIDFPEATLKNPTQCIALTIAPEKIGSIEMFLNETTPRLDDRREWQFADFNYHFTNDVAVNQIINRLIFLFTENHPSKDIFADFMLRELLIRLMQAESRQLFLENIHHHADQNRLAVVLEFIRQNLREPLSVEQLSKKAYMSQSHFFRCFKNQFGVSPIDFVNAERIRQAGDLLRTTTKNVYEICLETGFNNLSYFGKLFKRHTGQTPSDFQHRSQKRFPDA